jgi:hypothetical protein
LLAALLAAAAAGPSGARQATADTAPNINLSLTQGILNAIPPPADAPLLDANGNVVLDASGNPVSDPAEKFHQVHPSVFDPAHTNLVESGWMDGIGCPTNAFTYDGSTTTAFTDSACTTGDSKDKKNEGLLLVKTGPTSNFAAAVAELKKVKGISLTELGYDIRKSTMTGSHCGAGAPRFNVYTTDGMLHFVGCSSPPGVPAAVSDGWQRLRWGPTELSAAFPPITSLETVQRIFILFDEGQDLGPADSFGAAILDNIDVNGMLVGHGPDED